jgi:hypothetical protein
MIKNFSALVLTIGLLFGAAGGTIASGKGGFSPVIGSRPATTSAPVSRAAVHPVAVVAAGPAWGSASWFQRPRAATLNVTRAVETAVQMLRSQTRRARN